MTKPILCLDFDGVCNSYVSGWKGIDIILDPPVDGLFEFILEANEYFDIQIFSSRSSNDDGINSMKQWFAEYYSIFFKDKPNEHYILDIISFPKEKPPAKISIDDRAITFTGKWPNIETLKNFKPWNK